MFQIMKNLPIVMVRIQETQYYIFKRDVSFNHSKKKSQAKI